MLPFKSHNSKLIGEPEELRERTWLVNLNELLFTSKDEDSFNKNLVDNFQIYEKFKLQVDSIGISVIHLLLFYLPYIVF